MKAKIEKRIYLLCIILTVLSFGASGLLEVTKNPVVWVNTLELGYPAHFIYFLGVAKLLGVTLLIIPNGMLWLKEWVFAGLFFDISFAFCSKFFVLGITATPDTVLAMVMVIITYILFRRMHPRKYFAPSNSQHTPA